MCPVEEAGVGRPTMRQSEQYGQQAAPPPFHGRYPPKSGYDAALRYVKSWAISGRLHCNEDGDDPFLRLAKLM